MTKRERGDLIYGVAASALYIHDHHDFLAMRVSLVGGYAAARAGAMARYALVGE